MCIRSPMPRRRRPISKAARQPARFCSNLEKQGTGTGCQAFAKTMMKISIASTDRVFVLTGAGISAESGLPTFRASDGLWAGHRIEEVCTPEALETDPWLVWQFYSMRRADCAKVQPNPAHIALAEL